MRDFSCDALNKCGTIKPSALVRVFALFCPLVGRFYWHTRLSFGKRGQEVEEMSRRNSSSTPWWRITVLIVVLIGSVTVSGKVVYVDANAHGADDGTTWEKAYNFLQDALADANSSEKSVEIKVAQGLYTPDRCRLPNLMHGNIAGAWPKGGKGGALSHWDDSITLTNCTITGNTTLFRGGRI